MLNLEEKNRALHADSDSGEEGEDEDDEPTVEDEGPAQVSDTDEEEQDEEEQGEEDEQVEDKGGMRSPLLPMLR